MDSQEKATLHTENGKDQPIFYFIHVFYVTSAATVTQDIFFVNVDEGEIIPDDNKSMVKILLATWKTYS